MSESGDQPVPPSWWSQANLAPSHLNMSSVERMSKRRDNGNKWTNYGLRFVVNTASHPFEYAKVLIQIGYEPIAPRPAKTLFGKPALKLPNLFEYVKYIKTVDGFVGLYTGLAPKLCGNLLSTIATDHVDEYLKRRQPTDVNVVNELDDEYTQENTRKEWMEAMKRDIITHTVGIFVSQPFHVITVRMMARFAGREQKYLGLLSSIREIYTENGVRGFFSGFIPRLVGDILTLLVAGGLAYTINRYFIEEQEIKVYVTGTMNFIVTSLLYPFQVVSTCMAVNGSGLAVAQPPIMPLYYNWIDCFLDLKRQNQLKRGSSILVRYYTGPQVTVAGRLMPVLQDPTNP